jgi:hypothetical protein
MAYTRFLGTKTFWREYGALTEDKKAAADAAFLQFRENPFAPSLGAHKIGALSAIRGEAIWSVRIMNDLRALFVVRADAVITISIGTHDVYKQR